MARTIFVKLGPVWKDFIILVDQFYKLVKIPDYNEKENFLGFLREIDPDRLQEITDSTYEVNFEQKFKNEVSQPANRLCRDLPHRIQTGDKQEFKEFFCSFVKLLEKMDKNIDEIRTCLGDPRRRLPQLADKNEITKIPSWEEKERIAYNNYKNSYNYFINEYRKFLLKIEREYGEKFDFKPAFKPNFMREFD